MHAFVHIYSECHRFFRVVVISFVGRVGSLLELTFLCVPTNARRVAMRGVRRTPFSTKLPCSGAPTSLERLECALRLDDEQPTVQSDSSDL